MPEDHESYRVEAIVTEALPNALFRVKLSSGQGVVAHVATQLRLHVVRILPGDRVVLELSPYDLRRGRIVEKKQGIP